MIGRNRFYYRICELNAELISYVRGVGAAFNRRREGGIVSVLSCVIHTWNEGKAIPFARNSYWRSRDDRCELRAVKACRGSKPRSSGGREEGGAIDCREIKRKKTRPTCL